MALTRAPPLRERFFRDTFRHGDNNKKRRIKSRGHDWASELQRVQLLNHTIFPAPPSSLRYGRRERTGTLAGWCWLQPSGSQLSLSPASVLSRQLPWTSPLGSCLGAVVAHILASRCVVHRRFYQPVHHMNERAFGPARCNSTSSIHTQRATYTHAHTHVQAGNHICNRYYTRTRTHIRTSRQSHLQTLLRTRTRRQAITSAHRHVRRR